MSEVGRGTTFVVYLPLKAAGKGDAQKGVHSEPMKACDFSGYKILLVDDNPVNILYCLQAIPALSGLAAKPILKWLKMRHIRLFFEYSCTGCVGCHCYAD
jgi:hypothetical protein